MAFLRKTRKSSYWTLKYRDLETGRWREESLKLRHDDADETRKAKRLCLAASEKEAKVAPEGKGSEFNAWVSTYIAGHYRSASSKKRYEVVWQNLSEWIRLKNIRHPRQVKYEHANEFMEWRKSNGASHNTARLELKFFSFIMQEAMRRDHTEKNPLALAKIERTQPKEKADLTSSDLLACREAFKNGPAWMRTVFEVCAHIGCRFAEASVPMGDVDFTEGLLWITDSKRRDGDRRKRYAVPMPDSLRDYLLTIKDQARTCPVLTREMNSRFNYVLKGACGATSHSLRVSFISRCHRAGLSESQAMRLVNHSTEAVHRVYTRLNLNDVRGIGGHMASHLLVVIRVRPS